MRTIVADAEGLLEAHAVVARMNVCLLSVARATTGLRVRSDTAADSAFPQLIWTAELRRDHDGPAEPFVLLRPYGHHDLFADVTSSQSAELVRGQKAEFLEQHGELTRRSIQTVLQTTMFEAVVARDQPTWIGDDLVFAVHSPTKLPLSCRLGRQYSPPWTPRFRA